jgi:ATP-dependent protease ClpP protease subunit
MKKILFTVLLSLTVLGQARTPAIDVNASKQIIRLSESNTLSFDDEFNLTNVSKLQQKVMEIDSKLPKGEPIRLVLNTPGGSVMAGKLLIDTLSALDREIQTLTIFAASMGYNLVQAMGKRYILPSGVLMSHRAAVSGVKGQIDGELESRVDFYKQITEDLEVQAATRVGVDVDQYKRMIINELWITGAKAVKLNHADEVVLATCDASLKGVVQNNVNTLFGRVYYTTSKCPLITGILDFSLPKGMDLSDLESILGEHKFENRFKSR